MKFDIPSDKAIDVDGNPTPSWMALFTKLRNGIVWRSQAATTAQRPITGVEIGTPYYDTTLNKPIWAKTVPGGGAAITWVDATGGVV